MGIGILVVFIISIVYKGFKRYKTHREIIMNRIKNYLNKRNPF